MIQRDKRHKFDPKKALFYHKGPFFHISGDNRTKRNNHSKSEKKLKKKLLAFSCHVASVLIAWQVSLLFDQFCGF